MGKPSESRGTILAWDCLLYWSLASREAVSQEHIVLWEVLHNTVLTNERPEAQWVEEYLTHRKPLCRARLFFTLEWKWQKLSAEIAFSMWTFIFIIKYFLLYTVSLDSGLFLSPSRSKLLELNNPYLHSLHRPAGVNSRHFCIGCTFQNWRLPPGFYG